MYYVLEMLTIVSVIVCLAAILFLSCATIMLFMEGTRSALTLAATLIRRIEGLSTSSLSGNPILAAKKLSPATARQH
jgi:hypothetical protein